MISAAESNELFLSALESPLHSTLPNSGICKVIFETKLLNPVLFSSPSQNTNGVLSVVYVCVCACVYNQVRPNLGRNN